MNVVVNGLMTSYQKFGNGNKTLVFLHGWADSSKTFMKVISELKNDYTIYALDMPGFGASQRPEAAWGTNDFSKFVADWLSKMDIKDVHAFVAHSFGATAAINGLANGQLKAKKLVLIAAAGIRNKDNAKKAVMKLMAKTAKLGFVFMPKTTRQRVRARVYGKLGSDLLVLGEMEPSFRRIINEDMQPQAAKLNLPTLLVFGENDDQTPPADGRTFNDLITNSRLEIVNDAGHFVHQEKANQVAGLIKDFLNA